MKDIRIFIASSKELVQERNELSFLVLAKEDEFAQRGLRVRLAKWEYVDPKMTAGRTEDRYLDEMYNCDAAMVIFKNVAGKYTREELEKALAREAAGKDRLKTHKILFCSSGDPDSDATKLRDTLPAGSYDIYSNGEELCAAFLSLVEEIAASDHLVDAPEDRFREISAFVAADDELAADRNAFADAVLNLNDILARRGIRVKMCFYDPEHHRELLESSEMALVLYQTKCGVFSTTALKESYDRAKEEKNPKRLYVFFRDAAGKPLDGDFQAFKEGFAESFGSAPCRFENVDTLSLNFLFALESVLGDGSGTFVKLDGQMVVADGLEVGDLTKLPMLKKNAGLADLFGRMEDVSKRFVSQREKCDMNPQDDGLYVELLDLSAEKNRLQDQIDRELKMSFDLAKRLAAISIAQVNETIARARAKVEEGDIKGALEILDGASSALKRRRLLQSAADRAEAEELQIKELKAGAEIEYFRVDAVMAYTVIPFEERFKKAKEVLLSLSADCRQFFALCAMRNQDAARGLLAEAQEHLAVLLGEYGDSKDGEAAWASAIENYRELAENDPSRYRAKIALSLNSVGLLHARDGQYEEAEKEFGEALGIFSDMSQSECCSAEEMKVALIHNLAYASQEKGEFAEAEVLESAALELATRATYGVHSCGNEAIAAIEYNLACLHSKTGDFSESKAEFESALARYRRLADDGSLSCLDSVARILEHQADALANPFPPKEEYLEAERKYIEAVEIWRQLVERNPVAYGANLVMALHGLGALHMHGTHHMYVNFEKVDLEFQEADDLKRRLGLRNLYKPSPKASNLLSRQDFEDEEDEWDFEIGEEDIQPKIVRRKRLLKVHRWLAKADPEKFKTGFDTALRNLEFAYRDAGIEMPREEREF